MQLNTASDIILPQERYKEPWAVSTKPDKCIARNASSDALKFESELEYQVCYDD